MIARNVSESELNYTAINTGVRIENYRRTGNRHQFVLRLTPAKKYQRIGHTGRKVAAVCWHGHRDFFRELFRVAPTAVVTTHWAGGSVRYDASTFEDTYWSTGTANIGSMVEPMQYRDACHCDE